MKKLELLKKELKSIQYNTTDKKLINIKVEEYNYTEDSELNNFLNNKSNEILNIIGNSTLILGKIFEEVKELCNKKEAENIYCAWLEYNGFNRMTALRYRNRYNVFKKIENAKAREIIAITSQKNIDTITKILEDNQEILNELEKIEKNEDIEKVAGMYIINNVEEEKKISIVERQTTNIFKKLEKEIKNNNINVVKKELAGFKNLIKELESQIEEQIEKNMSENNLKLYEE